jgi:hypothetical protein
MMERTKSKSVDESIPDSCAKGRGLAKGFRVFISSRKAGKTRCVAITFLIRATGKGVQACSTTACNNTDQHEK